MSIQNIFTFLATLAFVSVSAQDVDFKKGIVYVDDKECLKYDSDATSVTFQNNEGNDIVYLKFIRVNGALYTKVIFPESRQELTSESYIFTKKNLMDKMLKSKVIQNCELNEEAVANFVMKYDEGVEKRNNSTHTNTVIIKEDSPRSGVNINIGK